MAKNPKKKPNNKRVFYSEEQKRLVMERYQYCITREDKIALAQQLGMESIEQLYNLANRLGATKPQAMEDDGSRGGAAKLAFDAERLLLRDPIDISWSKNDDSYLKERFGNLYIEEIAFHLRRTESAVLYRARKLGLRRYCKYWPAENIVAWVGKDEEELKDHGMDIYECADRRGRIAIRLVSTTSLLRLITNSQFFSEIKSGDYDPFFLKELDELCADWRNGFVPWEDSRWVSHGHTCLNPWAGVSFGLFDDGSDYKMPGRELYPSDISL